MIIEYSDGALQDLIRLQAEDKIDVVKFQKKIERRIRWWYRWHKIFQWLRGGK